uniref:hypothetical protein n=1 Tax=Fomitopsis dickinsii TaxID=3151107 RepID=UPI002A7FD662|nr:hypothetical protein UYH45_mgp03 [Daedalea dickinsii]WNZ34367.1 hypothetical protein [Daedalea dickinsii]
MYKPNGLNKDIYCYDVNSLYPSVMHNNKFPVGNIIQFQGNINVINENNDKYWIGDCIISNKKDMSPPIQLHYNITGKAGDMRTLSVNGKFNMKINSVEYHAYKDYYNFNINNGFIFKTDYIFKDIINNLYEMRRPKSDPMNYICKLIMNSLYGRFAMRNIKNNYSFFYKSEFFKLLEDSNIEIINYIDLDSRDSDPSIFVNYIDKKDLDNDSKSSIFIASAVTAYARSFMYNFINDNLRNIYYSAKMILLLLHKSKIWSSQRIKKGDFKDFLKNQKLGQNSD